VPRDKEIRFIIKKSQMAIGFIELLLGKSRFARSESPLA